MALGLAGLGMAAGGFATGLQQGQSMRRQQEDERRREEEYQFARQNRERQRAIDEATGQRLANVGQDVPVDYQMPAGASGNLDSGEVFRPVKQRYTEEQAWQDISRDIGKLKGGHMAAAQARTTGLQLAKHTREDNQARLMERARQLAMQHQTGALPEAEALRQLASLYREVPDGKQAFVVDVGGVQHAVLGDEKTNIGKVVPIDGSGATFTKALQGLYSLLDPKYGLELQRLRVTEDHYRRQDDTAAKNAAAMEQWRKQQAEHWERMDRRQADATGLRMNRADELALSNAEGLVRSLETQLAKSDDANESRALGLQLRRARGALYDQQRRLKVLPEGTTRTQFIGMPDPWQVARTAMQGAQSAEEMQASIAQFDALYSGIDDEAVQPARDSMLVFMQQQFARRQPQPGVPLGVHVGDFVDAVGDQYNRNGMGAGLKSLGGAGRRF